MRAKLVRFPEKQKPPEGGLNIPILILIIREYRNRSPRGPVPIYLSISNLSITNLFPICFQIFWFQIQAPVWARPHVPRQGQNEQAK